jgi:hypothetical protein
MQLLDLDLDCLTEVLSVCTKDSLLALSRTSSQVNTLVTPFILSSVEFGGIEFAKMELFLRLIVEGNGNVSEPGRHVRHLKLTAGSAVYYYLYNTNPSLASSPPNLKFNWGYALTRALELMPNLRSFEMGHGFDSLLVDCPRLASVLMSRPQLRRLLLREVQPITGERLGEAVSRTTPAQLRCLAIGRLVKFGGNEFEIMEGFGKVLAEARESLIEVSFSGYNLQSLIWPTNSEGQESTTTLLSFPFVATLKLYDCKVSHELISKSFPALRILTIRNLEVTSVARDNHPILCPELCSLSGPLRYIQMILKPGHPHYALRRLEIPIDSISGRHYETYDDDQLLSALPVTPNLRSLHIWLYKYDDDHSWHNIVNQWPSLTFLRVDAHPQTPPNCSHKFLVRALSYTVT